MSDERQRDKERTRTAILDVTETIILSLGPAALRLDAVAKQAGVSKSVIFYHFGSKQKLLTALKMRQADGYAKGLAETLDNTNSGPDSLETAFREYFQFLRDNPKAQRTLSWGYIHQTHSNPVLADLRGRAIATAAKARESGLLRADIDPRALIIAAFSIIEHWFEIRYMFAAEGLPMDDQHYLEQVVKLLQHGCLSTDSETSDESG